MYDMYPWNDRPATRLPAPRDGRHPLPADAPAAKTEPAKTEPAEAEAGKTEPAETETAAEATQAVQVALDRRDNGGDAVGAVSPTTLDRTRQ